MQGVCLKPALPKAEKMYRDEVMNVNDNGYNNYFVAAIDILGFSQYVRTNSFDYVNDVFTDIKKFTNLVLNYPNENFTKEILDTVTLNIISDTIVIAVPEDTYRSLEILLLIVDTVVFNLYREYRLPCRGGIAYGEFYSDSNIAFGKAFIDAHELECLLAVTPRIIFPRSVYDVYAADVEKNELLNLTDIMMLEADDELFIANYFGFAMRRCACDVETKRMSSEYAESLFEVICREIEHELCVRTDKRVRDKYIYLRDYYNAQLDMLRHEADNMGISIPFKIRKVFGNDNCRDQ